MDLLVQEVVSVRVLVCVYILVYSVAYAASGRFMYWYVCAPLNLVVCTLGVKAYLVVYDYVQVRVLGCGLCVRWP